MALLASAACNSQPLPLVARAGTTIGIAVGGDYLDGAKIGYGAPVYQDQNIFDTQRGSIKIELRRDGFQERLLEPRLITRVQADPATLFAMDPSLSEYGRGLLAGVGQVLALMELPSDLAAGTWNLRFKRFDGSGQPVGSPQAPYLSYDHPLEVLEAAPGEVDFNDLLAFFSGAPSGGLDLAANNDVRLLYPWPKVVVRIEEATGAAAVAAAHLVLTYPTQRIASILNVFDEKRVGQQSIVQWSDDPANGQLTIDLVDPSVGIDELAVVFEPEPGQGAIAASELVPQSTAFYDVDGDPTTASLNRYAIR